MSREREEIRAVIASIVAMADEVGGFLRTASAAFIARDSGVLSALHAKDSEIDRMENANDAKCLRILALYQPAADDLRTVFMALKINNDLERIGDHALNIAERSVEMQASPIPILKDEFDRMTELTLGMLGDAINAFVARDAVLARSVVERDDLADGLFLHIVEAVLSGTWRDRPERECAVAMVFAAKEFERIADLCTNLAEDVVFVAEGTNIRHEGQM
jgi:phosphate transport system protein